MADMAWHDEMERFERTGRLDQGPCWCKDCIAREAATNETETEHG